jgi:hypothetical protein
LVRDALRPGQLGKETVIVVAFIVLWFRLWVLVSMTLRGFRRRRKVGTVERRGIRGSDEAKLHLVWGVVCAVALVY